MRLSAVVVVVLLASQNAHAHALHVQCRLNDGMLSVVAFYSDDSPARAARVKILDAKQNLVVEERLDEFGKWNGPAPESGNYFVVVDTGDGHRKTLEFAIVPDGGTNDFIDTSTRANLTRFPIKTLAIGLVVIAATGAVLRIVMTRKVRRSSDA